MGFLQTSYRGEAYYIITTIFSFYLLIFLTKFYYKSVRFEFCAHGRHPVFMAVYFAFQEFYYLFEGMRWPYAIPLLSVLACFALGRIKYEQNGSFSNHKSLTLAILGIFINSIILQPCLNMDKILSSLKHLPFFN